MNQENTNLPKIECLTMRLESIRQLCLEIKDKLGINCPISETNKSASPDDVVDNLLSESSYIQQDLGDIISVVCKI
jgi:hypothetical protein